MRTLIRAGILLAAAGGFCIGLSLSASADVVEPRSAYQPSSTGLLEKEAAASAALADLSGSDPAKADAAAKAEKAAAKEKAAEKEKADKPSEPVVATPAPEQVVRPARVPVMQSSSTVSVSLVDRITHPLRIGLESFEASLGRVVSACDIGFGSGAGGPVLVLAVLALALVLIRRRVIGTRSATDEDMPEFLFAWEQTPPG